MIAGAEITSAAVKRASSGGSRRSGYVDDLHAIEVRRCLCLRKDAERSLRNLCLAACTTFMGLLSNISVFCALQASIDKAGLEDCQIGS